MIETMNERREHFVSEMRKCGLLHDIEPSVPIPRLESSLYNDYKSSFALESNVVDNAPLTDLKEVFDPPLTSFCHLLFHPFLAPHSH